MVSRFSGWAACLSAVSVVAFAAAANTTASAAPWCATDDLVLSTGALTTTEYVNQDQLELLLTNISQQSCTLQGYPGVDLVGPDVPTWGPVFSLARQSGDPQPFTLEPGASATSILTIGEPSLPEDYWLPTTLVVTPPDATTQLQIPWIPSTAVQRQDGATSPATYIGPLQPSN
ncbi:DUF4232 domain-containing protein [Mycolicibacterium tusciae]|uniref:DUF4232 domain-containing protein n=1 Tax=Mycolicibacterium tusciae TaxID=75922 RepID=UPI00024A2E7B|nr:DUF4232 domain-containing protein [Mycolicibacterium tusciae]